MKFLECQGIHRGKYEMELTGMTIYLECALQLSANLYSKYLFSASALGSKEKPRTQSPSSWLSSRGYRCENKCLNDNNKHNFLKDI